MPIRPRLLLFPLALLIAALHAPSALLAQSSWENIVGRGELRIVTDATYPPFEATVNSQIVGFDADLCVEIGKELNIKTKFETLDWAGVLPSLQSHKADLVISGITITEERRSKGYIFSRPYFLSGQTIARRKDDNSINSMNDLKDKLCSAQDETTGQKALEKAGIPKDHIVKFDTLPDGLTDVRNGKSVALVADVPALKRQVRGDFKDLVLVGGVVVSENLGIVAWNGNEELISRVNYALERIMLDGRYAKLYEKWMDEPFQLSMLAGLEREKNAGTPVPVFNPATAGQSSSGQPVEERRITLVSTGEILHWLLIGAKLTIVLTLLALVFGIPSGLLLALLNLSRTAPLRFIAQVYIELIRGTPLLIQIYVIYFVLPLAGINLSSFNSGVLALSLNAAAYIAEIFRAGIQSIERGQMEAAKALGMNYRQAMRYVILPQAGRRVLPPLTNEGVALLKDTSLVSVVGLSETMRSGKDLVMNSGEPMRIYFTVALLYLCMTLPLTFLTRYLERRWKTESRG